MTRLTEQQRSLGQAASGGVEEAVGSMEVSYRSQSSGTGWISGNEPNGEQADEAQNLKDLIRNESKHVRLWRFNVFALLGITACVMSSMTYVFLNWEDENDFDASFWQFALTIQDATEFNLRSVLDASNGLSEAMTSEAAKSQSTTTTSDGTTSGSSSRDSVWPFFTMSSFEVVSSSTRSQARTELVVVCPLVKQDQLAEWATYSQNNQDWIDESFSAQDARGSSSSSGRSDLNPIPTSVYRFGRYKGRTVLKPEDGGDGEFPSAPFWTMSPPPFDTSIVNYNAMDDPDTRQKFTRMVDSRSFVLGRAKKNSLIDYAISQEDHDALHGSTTANATTTSSSSSTGGFADEHPHTELMYPVFNKLRDPSSPIVAYIVSVLAWDVYLTNLLPSGVNGIYCVLRNSCGQEYTYMVNGNTAVFVGAGDAHESAYDDREFVIDFDAILALAGRGGINGSGNTSDCHYWFSIYPSVQLESVYQSEVPLTMSLCVAAAFVVMALTFLVYDLFVIRKNNKILNAAMQSNTIVSSLFPSAVRDRLYQENALAKEVKRDAVNPWGQNEFGNDDESESDLITSKPNAEVYKECTVLFADLVGFTKWSSTRDPTAVFALLENLYRRFDLIAKHRRVFKVETIGDCYVACTGLPQPRKDHALAISRFAQECLVEMPLILAKLEEILGTGTSDLSMRFGLHSGPVTAGVLRGQKSRFQLFGDTVNTAARMESNSERGRIHASQDTANLIIAAGRGHWLTARDKKIGKGEMQTYWVRTHNNGSGSDRGSSANGIGEDNAAGPAPANEPLAGKNPAAVAMQTVQFASTRSDTSTEWA